MSCDPLPDGIKCLLLGTELVLGPIVPFEPEAVHSHGCASGVFKGGKGPFDQKADVLFRERFLPWICSADDSGERGDVV